MDKEKKLKNVLIEVENIKNKLEYVDVNIENVFDLGANLGYYSVAFYKVFNNSNIFSFEPVSENFIKMINLFENNNLKDKINSYNFGLGSEERKIKLGIPGHRDDKKANSGLYSTFYADEDEDYNIQTCNIKNLNSFCKRNSVFPDLLKIDVEGMEFEILDSIKDNVLEKIKAVYIEVNFDSRFGGEDNQNNINDLLINAGFYCIYPPLDYYPGPSSKNPGYLKSYNRLWVNKSV
jgi:FkbM family methyltransferase